MEKENANLFSKRFNYAVKKIVDMKSFSESIHNIEPLKYFETKKDGVVSKNPLALTFEELEEKLNFLNINELCFVNFKKSECYGDLEISDTEDFKYECICTHPIENFYLFKVKEIEKYFFVGSSCQKKYINADKKKLKKLKKEFKEDREKKIKKEQKKEEKKKKEKLIEEEKKKKQHDFFLKMIDEEYGKEEDLDEEQIFNEAKKIIIKNGNYAGNSWFWMYENKFNVIGFFHSQGNALPIVEKLYQIYKKNKK